MKDAASALEAEYLGERCSRLVNSAQFLQSWFIHELCVQQSGCSTLILKSL